MSKKIKIILYLNEIKQEYENDIIITEDNSYSLQNEGDPLPAMTIAMNKKGDLMINTNSAEYIVKKSKLGGQAWIKKI